TIRVATAGHSNALARCHSHRARWRACSRFQRARGEARRSRNARDMVAPRVRCDAGGVAAPTNEELMRPREKCSTQASHQDMARTTIPTRRAPLLVQQLAPRTLAAESHAAAPPSRRWLGPVCGRIDLSSTLRLAAAALMRPNALTGVARPAHPD